MNDFQRALLPTCLDVESGIVGHPPKLAQYWARCNAIRHSHTLLELLSVKRGTTLRILNASGLSCGHQDFSITSYLLAAGVAFEWIALESPRSAYLTHPQFRRLVSETGVDIRYVDYSSPAPLACMGGEFDAILFTEIAEHLDHSAFLRSLSALHPLLSDRGRIIVTTPNLLSIGNRLKLVLGRGDAPYWGDGQANLHAGLFGHIVNYDRRRLSRLLRDSGFEPVKTFTFDYQPDPGGFFVRFVRATLKALVPNSKSTLFVSAGKGAARPIPFQI